MNANDIEFSKGFARSMAYGIEGLHDDPKAALETVLTYFRKFIAARARVKDPLPKATSVCIKNVSYNIVTHYIRL